MFCPLAFPTAKFVSIPGTLGAHADAPTTYRIATFAGEVPPPPPSRRCSSGVNWNI